MSLRSLSVPLAGFGVPADHADVTIDTLSPPDRVKRGAKLLGICLIVALIAAPIPIVHLMLVPGAILLGLVLFVRSLAQGEIFKHAEGKCPFCHQQQTFTVMGKFSLPRQVTCGNCRQPLTLGPKQ
ncbi:MAG: hypothetical protein ABJD11_03750 [Gemmatimonadota bacterium]